MSKNQRRSGLVRVSLSASATSALVGSDALLVEVLVLTVLETCTGHWNQSQMLIGCNWLLLAVSDG